MNHLRDRVPHLADGLCQYVHQYNNKVLICKVRLTRHQLGPSSLCGVSYLDFVLDVACCAKFQAPFQIIFDPILQKITHNITVFYINFSF